MAIDASSSVPTPTHACDEGIAIVAGRQSVGVDDYNEQDSEIVRPGSMESGQIKCPGGRIKQRAQRPKSYKRKKMWPAGPKSAELDKDDNFIPTRKRGRPAGSKSAKSKMGQKPALAYSSSSDSEDERDEEDDIDPTRKRRLPAGSKFAKNNKDEKFVPTRKRGRPAGSISAKIKMGRKPAFTRIGSTNSEGKRGKYDVFDPTVPDANGRKEHARVQGRCGPAFKKASGVQEKFTGQYPSFTKCMVPSNVLRVFWLHLSSDFCRTYLPKCNARMTLEDENGKRDYANYLSGSYGLSGGWRGYAIDHSLKVGDTVVFELVMPTKFKVYIRRANESTTTDDDVKSKDGTEVTRASSSAPDDAANNLASEEAVGNVDGMRSPNPNIEDLDGMPSFKNFNIFIDGLLVNPELFSDRLRGTYYQLCRDRKALLHRNLLKNIRPTLVIAVIMETTNIAKGISAAASREDLAAWKKILESFELLGMDVSFLRKRVDDLLGITARSSTDQPSVECEGYKEVKLEKDHAAEKMRALNSKMVTVKDAMRAVDIEMKEMESSVKKYVQAVRQMVTAP